MAGTKILSKSDDFAKSGVWAMNHFARGYEIERALGGWANNFPKIDWAKKTVLADGTTGVLDSIVSIKSLDITRKTYQNPGRLTTKLKTYINSLRDFETASYNGIDWFVAEGSSRTLKLAIPAVEMTSAQAKAFQVAMEYAEQENVNLIIEIVS